MGKVGSRDLSSCLVWSDGGAWNSPGDRRVSTDLPCSWWTSSGLLWEWVVVVWILPRRVLWSVVGMGRGRLGPAETCAVVCCGNGSWSSGPYRDVCCGLLWEWVVVVWVLPRRVLWSVVGMGRGRLDPTETCAVVCCGNGSWSSGSCRDVYCGLLWEWVVVVWNLPRRVLWSEVKRASSTVGKFDCSVLV